MLLAANFAAAHCTIPGMVVLTAFMRWIRGDPSAAYLCLPPVAGPQERLDFTTLLREMYPACKAAGLLLTAATRAASADQHYELSEVHKYLDW